MYLLEGSKNQTTANPHFKKIAHVCLAGTYLRREFIASRIEIVYAVTI